MRKLISILITYYNEKELIGRCLESLNKQQKLPDEVIIYDDASKEKAENFINKSLYSFPIEIIRNDENKGPAHGRNVLVKMANAEYIRFQDADDELFENALYEIEQRILKTDSDIILNEVSSFNEKNELICERVIGLNLNLKNLFEFSLSHALLIPSITYKREFALTVGGFKDRSILPQSEDSDFNRRTFLKTNNFSFIDLALAKQNIRTNSHSSKSYDEVWPSGLKSLLSLKNEIKPQHLPAYGEALLQTALRLYENKNYTIAKIAFREYVNEGYSAYKGYNSIKKLMAKTIGPLTTEHFSRFYRSLIPEIVRRNFNPSK